MTSPSATLSAFAAAGKSERLLKVAFVCSVFPPEPEPSGAMAWELARQLSRDGHGVSMLVPFPSRPGGVLYAGYRRACPRVETREGVRIVRCPNWLLGPKRRSRDRILENLTFGISTAVAALAQTRPDVMVLETWPLLAVQLDTWTARARGVPVLYYVKDVYPEAAENAGIIERNSWLARRLRRWDRRLCLGSSRVVAISPAMRDLLAASRGIPRERIAVVPDWIDQDEIRPLPRDSRWRREMGIPGSTFLALFAGNLGLVSGADLLIEAATALRDRHDLLIQFVGDGLLRSRMVEEARRRGLANVRFLPFQPRERLPELLSSADAFLLTMREGCSGASVPSKLVSYMAAGRPVVCAAPPSHEVSAAVRAARAGFVLSPEDAAGIAGALLWLQDNPDACARLGGNARAHFEQNWTFAPRYRQWLELLQEAARSNP